jgi:ATP-dependent DNA helicase RecG
MGEASVSELKSVMEGALPAMLDERQQSRKVSNILQAMKKDGDADVKGSGHAARWYLVRKEQ